MRKSPGYLVLALTVTATVALGGCSPSETARQAASTQESDAPVQGSQETHFAVQNTLTLADGTPLTVTWQVTDTKNEFWDGDSRPDHAPPQGLQGLVQESGSGTYNVRLEINPAGAFGSYPNFTMTPYVEIAGEQVALEPWYIVQDDGWRLLMWSDSVSVCYHPHSFATSTKQGLLRYTVTASCSKSSSSFTLSAEKIS